MIYLSVVLCTLWRYVTDDDIAAGDDLSTTSGYSICIPRPLLRVVISMKERGINMRGLFAAWVAGLVLLEFASASFFCSSIFGYYSLSTVFLTSIVMDLFIICCLVFMYTADQCIIHGMNDLCEWCPLDEIGVDTEDSETSSEKSFVCLRLSFVLLRKLAWNCLKLVAWSWLWCRGQLPRSDDEEEDDEVTSKPPPLMLDDEELSKKRQLAPPNAVVVDMSVRTASKSIVHQQTSQPNSKPIKQ
jgi:hypothetical protein